MTRIRFGSPIHMKIQEEILPHKSLLESTYAQNQNFTIYILKSAYDQMREQINTNPNIETGGVLVGYPFKEVNRDTEFVIITSVIEQKGEKSNAYHFKVLPEEIIRSRKLLDEIHPGLLFAGWYHSHPGHGVFLSSQDKEIVRSIYDSSWQLSIVFDSISGKEGFFIGPEGIQIENNWVFLNQIPDSITAISLYNQAKESAEEGKYLSALYLISQIEELVQNSNQLSHWKKGYRDINKLRNTIVDEQNKYFESGKNQND